ncbi:MAG TPA: hypothetical protein VMD47_04820 [Candidatus Acidoferrales bacterium]|nr:hypothetical protein [Candidatus Acidoferrales bacterium]
MSTSYIGSDALTQAITPLTIPGFDVLNPYSYAASTANTASNTVASGSTSGSSSSASSSATGQNPYQQAVSSLEQWQYQTLAQALTGDTSDASAALYSSAGLNVDAFANLAYQLQELGASESGSTVDTTA